MHVRIDKSGRQRCTGEVDPASVGCYAVEVGTIPDCGNPAIADEDGIRNCGCSRVDQISGKENFVRLGHLTALSTLTGSGASPILIA